MLFIIACVLLPLLIFCQDSTLEKPRPPSQLDIKDWFVMHGIGKKKAEKNSFLFVVPVIGANPAAGFIYGGGFTYSYRYNKYSGRFSTVSSNASYSTENLLNLNIKSNLFTFNERLFLNGDWRYFIITENTYELGSITNRPGQELSYNHIRIHETASWRLLPNIFAGFGFHYDHHFNIHDNQLDTRSANPSYHYLYSTRHGFDPAKYITSGFSLNFLFDSRDNQVNSYKGSYTNINYRVNTTAFGSSKKSTILLAEYRSFHSLDGGKNRHILAFWLYGNFVVSGDVPYLSLPALGYDQRQKSGRGYVFGRFRGEDMLYAESEYRFPISKRTGILGGLVFLNLISNSSREDNIKLLNYFQEAYGAGLRVMLDKVSRTRLEFDAGIGHDTIAFYMGIRESF